MKACPYRKDLYAKLDSTDEELDAWLRALDNVVTHMQDFYEKGEYNKGGF